MCQTGAEGPIVPMDAILLAWLQSTDEPEAERLFAELIVVHAAPVIKQTLWRKLKFHLGGRNENPGNPDAEDLHQEIVAKLVQRLNDLRANPRRSSITSYRQFVARVAVNACHDYLRAKYPVRTRLKNSLRDLLTRHRDFKIWRDDFDQLLCGLAQWEQDTTGETEVRRIQDLIEQPDLLRLTTFAGQNLHEAPRTRLMAEVLHWAGAPVELDELVDALAALLELKDAPPLSLEKEESELSAQLPNPAAPRSVELEGQAELRRFWDEVRQLSRPLRHTICFGFADERGEDLISLLVLADARSLPELAADLDLTLDELRDLWARAPLDNEALATHLGATRQQVIKWRHRAWQQLAKRMGLAWRGK